VGGVPERCPVCGGYTAVRDFLHGVGVSDAAEMSSHRERVVMYCSTTVEENDSVCAECAGVIAERSIG
jgi:hypothetical protein